MVDIDGTSFLTGASAGFIADPYTRFLDDPAAVDESWRRFFAEIGEDAGTVLAELAPSRAKAAPPLGGNGRTAPGVPDAATLRQVSSDSIRVLQLIRAYRVRGHLEADLDPLRLGVSFLTRANAGFIADLYARFLDDPAAVDESYRRSVSEIGEDEL